MATADDCLCDGQFECPTPEICAEDNPAFIMNETLVYQTIAALRAEIALLRERLAAVVADPADTQQDNQNDEH